MTALDLTPYVPTESPEVAALKEKVREVAMRYAKRHSWCSEVKRALREIGIEDPRNVDVTVTTGLGFAITVNLPPVALHGKTEDQQKRIIAARISKLVITSTGGNVKGEPIALTPEMIVDMTLAAAASASGPDRATGWVYTSNQGRVLHHITEVSGRPEHLSLGSSGQYYYASCGITALGNSLTLESPKGEGRRCAGCERNISA